MRFGADQLLWYVYCGEAAREALVLMCEIVKLFVNGFRGKHYD